VRQILRNLHFWGILAIMGVGATVFYADQIPFLETFVLHLPLQVIRYSTYRILSIIPVAYSAFVFRLKGGLITVIFISLGLLPRALFISSERLEAIIETVAFLLIGILVTWLIHRQQLTVDRLKKTEQELQTDIQIIKNHENTLASLNRIASTVSESLDLHNILNHAIDNIMDLTQADVAWIFLLDEEKAELSLATYRGADEELAREVDRLKIGEGFNGRVAESGEPLIVEDASRDPRLTREIISKYQVRSTLIVPMMSKNKVNGTICIAMYDLREFQSEEAELLSAVGSQIGIAVENANLYQQERIITQQLQVSEERYRGIFENSSEAILVYSTTGRIIMVNKACTQLTGYSQDELINTTIFHLFSGVSSDKLKKIVLEDTDPVLLRETEEISLIKKDGTEASIELKVGPIYRNDIKIGSQIIARDVTEERQLRKNMDYYITQITRAQEDERLRISRELHDDTAQALANLSRGLDSLMSSTRGLEKPVINEINKLHDIADLALEGVRRYSQDLRPSILDDLGLVPAFEWLISNLEKNTGISVEADFSEAEFRLVPDKELAVFRICQEVLSNIRRHSGAKIVRITLDYETAALTIIIRDDGQGFVLPKRTSDLAVSGRLGIIGMRERARLVGGTLIIQSEIGKGTTVTLRIPD
jgi:PAS domain S-box-containing protein